MSNLSRNRIIMAKFWITIALLFSLIAQSAMANAMPMPLSKSPTSATIVTMQSTSHASDMKMTHGKMNCTMPNCDMADCTKHCQEMLAGNCQVQCVAQLYLSPTQLLHVPFLQVNLPIVTQAWAVQTADLGLTTPPPNFHLL
ncbi:hypothetical protein L9G16_07250 [Shewanella sp. A25]|nr:hypothetical protein [Shewanella shenzhenensis]